MRTVRQSSITLAFVCALLTAVSAHAQTGAIAGTVVEDGTSTPLFGAGEQEFRVAAYTFDGSVAASVATDASGQYQIANLTPGTYFVKALIAPGYVRELHNNLACIADDCPVTAGSAVTVTAGATTTVNFSLAKEGQITGTVRLNVSTALGGQTVNIYNASTSYVASVTTAADGTYVANGLATGSYFARVMTGVNGRAKLYNDLDCPIVPASDCRLASGTPIAVTAGAITSGIDFTLGLGAAISGTVTADGSGTPLNGVVVTAYTGDIARGSATVDASGNYTISGLPPGRYRVRTFTEVLTGSPASAPHASYVNEWQNGACIGCSPLMPAIAVSDGATITDVNFSLALGGSIAGTVSCDSLGAPGPFDRGPEIAVFNATGELIRTNTNLQPTLCVTGISANYTVNGLPEGTYFLWARDTPLIQFGIRPQGGNYIDQLYGGLLCNTADCDVRKGVPVSVTVGATASGINFALRRGASVLLTTGSFGDKLKIYDARGIEVINAVGTAISAQPNVLVAGLPPGTYYFTLNDRLNGGITCLDCPPTAGVPIVVSGTTLSPFPSFAVPPRRVSGTITNVSGGAPLSTITVELVTRSGKTMGRATTDLLGRYTVAELAPGTYFARTVNDRGFVDEVYSDATCGTCDPRTGTPVIVEGTDITGIDFALASGGIVSGQVTDGSFNVLNNVPVSLFAGTTTFAGVKTTSASGRYRLTLPAGTYRALAEATTNKGSEIYSELPCTSAGCDPATGTAISVTTSVITSGIDFTLASCSALTLSPPVLATGVGGRAYRQVLSAIGGTGPYRFDLTDGALPLGLTLNASTGVLDGTPTIAGRSTFRVSLLDANGCATDRSYVLDVQACAFTLSPTSITVPAAGGNVTVAILNGCGSQDVTESLNWVSVQSNTTGEVTLVVAANAESTPRAASIGIGRRVFEIRQAAVGSQAPYGTLDLPTDGAQVSGAVAIGGWALDDLEVTHVRIFRDHVAGEPAGIVFLGNAVFIPGARPDVQQVSPGVPRNDRAGFGFMILTNTLPNQGNGSFRIHAVAEDAEGHQTLLGSRTIVSNNTTATVPFGTIDTPLQGDTISGASYINFGWALTPRPAMIPTDGSTIQVIIDGNVIGTVNYNHFRPDVSNTFPGLANSDGPVGFRAFDTTALAEGLHTISWMVTDSRPATAGLGSRYFTVVNSADGPAGGGSSVTATETEVPASDVATPLSAAPAPDMGRRAESLAATANATSASAAFDLLIQRGEGPKRRLRVSDDGTGALTLAPMERVELTLGTAADACPATWAGYLLKDNVLRDLPVGASLDPAGTFYWQTGPGFAGRFPLVFVQTNCRGEKQQVPVIVTIPNR